MAQRLHVHRFGFGVDEGFKTGGVFVVGKAGFNAELRKGVGKEVVSATIQSAGRHDVVPGFCDGLNRISDGGLTRGQRQCGDAAFKCRHPLFQHRLCGVHDAGVNVARHFQVEQISTMLGTVKGIGHGLVNGRHNRFGDGVGLVAGVHGQCFNFHGCLLLVVRCGSSQCVS